MLNELIEVVKDPDQPLGLKKGSIRSVLALIVITGTVAVATLLKDIATLKELSLVVLGFYFGSKINGGVK